jgi:hypothetical protein
LRQCECIETPNGLSQLAQQRLQRVRQWLRLQRRNLVLHVRFESPQFGQMSEMVPHRILQWLAELIKMALYRWVHHACCVDSHETNASPGVPADDALRRSREYARFTRRYLKR